MTMPSAQTAMIRRARGPKRPAVRPNPKIKRTHKKTVQNDPSVMAPARSRKGGLPRTLGSVKIVPEPITHSKAIGVNSTPATT